MDSLHWERIQALFHDAADLGGPERQAFLDNACADDPSLLAEVLAMLEEDSRGSSLLDRGMADAARQMLDHPDSLPPGPREFGPYEVEEVLGEGGTGIVYLGRRTDLGSLVAIKVLRDAWLSPARRERFASEQRTLAQLNHPSIARLYDADTLADGTPWFVMEYVEGLPLTAYCKKYECSIERRLQLFRQVCEAVQYAHAHAVIHRDLKPSNIFVKPDGSVRLLDFGIAKQIESLDESAHQTRTVLRLMTPAYAAPEQIRGEPAGVHTDVYSLGVILYELLAGQLPFDFSNLTPSEAASVVVGHEPGKPSAMVKALTKDSARQAAIDGKAAWAELDVVCLTALHKDPARRYRSVEALIRDVDHYLKGEPLEARPDSVRYRVGKFVSRNRRGVSAAVMAFCLIVGLVIFFTWRLAKARNVALAEAARTQRIQKFMTNLFQGGDADAGPADNLRVVTLLDRGVQEAQSLNAEPEVQAELYETLGTLYENLGKFEQANSLLSAALAERKSVFGPDNAPVAETLVALGLLRGDQAQLQEAESLVREGLAMTQRHLPPDHPASARAIAALGKVLDDRGSYDAAIATLGAAVQVQSAKSGTTPELATTLYELANANFYAGHYEQAEALNQRVLPMYRQIYGDHHPRVADVLINLGAIRHDLGHYAEAEPFERQALEIVQAWYGNDNPATADDLTILARTLVFENRFADAIVLLQQSLAIKERVYGQVHPSVASTLNELGNAASKQGNYDAAEQYYKRMIEIYRSIYGEHHYLYGIALSNLANVYSSRQEWSRAEPLFRQAVRIFTEAQSPTHINTGIARIKLGRTLLRQHRYAEAEAESRGGYDILIKQMDPKVSWLVSARKDLVEEYDALKQPEKAAGFRSQLADAPEKSPQVASKN